MASTGNLSDLQYECQARGLTVIGSGKDGKIKKMDCVKALEKWSLDGLSSQGLLLPGCNWIHNTIESPQLAEPQNVFKTDTQFKSFIDRSDISAEQKMDGCFSYDSPVLLSDGSLLPIGEIVENNLAVEVLSYNEKTGTIEPKRVIGWYNNGTKYSSEWLQVGVPRGKTETTGFGRRVGYGGENCRRTYVTKSHQFFNGNGYSRIDSTDFAYALVTEPNVYQEQVIMGSLLGDGCLISDIKGDSVSTRFQSGHCAKQKEYTGAISKVLGCFLNKNSYYKSGFGSVMYGLASHAFPFLKSIYLQEYVNGKKCFSKSFADKLQPLALAIWYMDDGSLEWGNLEDARSTGKSLLGRTFNSKSSLLFHTHGFDYDTVCALSSWFISRGMAIEIVHDPRWEDPLRYNFLRLSGDSVDFFCQIIAPYIHPSMAYKLPSQYRCLAGAVKWWDFSKEVLRLKKVPIKKHFCAKQNKIKNVNFQGGRTAYDIEIEGNHNYFVDGFLVHNCRMITTFFPGVGFELFSRNRSVENYLFCSYNDQVYGWQQDITRDILPFSFVIDGELISLNPSVNGRIVIDTMLAAVVAMLGMNQLDSHRMQAEAGYPLRFEAFDCLMFNGQSLINDSLLNRRKYLDEVVTKLHEAADRLSLPQLKWVEKVRIVRGGYKDKFSFYQEVISKGGEGLVLKADGSVYNGKEARGGLGAGFIKWKRNTSESIGGSIDAFIDGRFTPGEGKYSGMVGAVGFSVHLLPSGEVHPIAMISGISDDMRRAITSQDVNGSVVINPSWLGRVAEIEGQDISSKSRALSHARILRFRDGADAKSPAQCVIQEAMLNDMIL